VTRQRKNIDDDDGDDDDGVDEMFGGCEKILEDFRNQKVVDLTNPLRLLQRLQTPPSGEKIRW